MDQVQRVKILEDLLASNGELQRQRFAQRAAAISHPAVRATAVSKSVVTPVATSAFRHKNNPIVYFRRLNGEMSDGGMPDTKNKPAILLPHLNIEIGQNTTTNCHDAETFDAITHRFFAQSKNSQQIDLSRYNVLRFVFHLLNTRFLFGKVNIDRYDALLTNLAMKLYDLNERFLCNVAAVKFNSVAHEYYVNGQKMELSVTKSLDMLFGQFNSDEVAARMVKSRNWKRHSLFTAINFDENSKQRGEEEMCSLIQQEWQKRRDRGTVLHEFINCSLTRSTDMACQAAKDMTPTASVQVVSDRQANPGRTAKKDNEGHHAAGDEEKSAGIIGESTQQSANRRARLLWKKLQRRFCTEPVFGALRLSQKATSGSTNNDENAAELSENKKKSADSSLASISLLDDANVLAFTRWNQMRLNDHWLLLASEYTVYDAKAGIAGTIDAIFLPYPHRPDMVVLVDWKRSDLNFGTRYYGPNMCYDHEYTRRYPKCNYWKYAFQLNIYREILERAHEGRLIVIDMMIVNFLADSEFPRTYSVPRIPETRLFLDDLRNRKNNNDIVPLGAILTSELSPVS